MKRNSKLLSLVLVLTMILSAALTFGAFADPTYEGSITVNKPDGFSIDGMTFTAYKVFDVSYSTDKTAYTYTLATAFTNFIGYDGNAYTTEAQLISAIAGMTSDPGGMEDLAAQLYQYVSQDPAPAYLSTLVSFSKTVVGEDVESIVIDNDGDGLPLGYYLVFGSALAEGEDGDVEITAACSLTTTNPNGSVTPKVDAPTITKKVWNHIEGTDHTDLDDDGWIDWTDINIGDDAYFKISTAVPSMRGYNEETRQYSFTVYDVMSPGLTLNYTTDPKDGITVTLNGDPLIEGQDYYATVVLSTGAGVDTTIEIDFEPTVFIYYTKGDKIEITYSAVLNEHAVIAQAGNPNKAQLEYSTNPYKTTDKGRTPWTTVRVYTYKLDIYKFKSNTNPSLGVALPGAKFILYKDSAKTDPVFFTGDGSGNYIVKKLGTASDPGEEDFSGDDILESPASGLINIKGLDAGTYYLQEVYTPSGYNLDSTVKTIVIEKISIASDTKIVTYQINVDSSGLKNPVVTGAKPADVNVYNGSGNEFPTTGGIGTTLFYVCGLILVIGGAVAVIVKRKKDILEGK